MESSQPSAKISLQDQAPCANLHRHTNQPTTWAHTQPHICLSQAACNPRPPGVLRRIPCQGQVVVCSTQRGTPQPPSKTHLARISHNTSLTSQQQAAHTAGCSIS